MEFGSCTCMNSNHFGTMSGFLISRYQTGVMNMVNSDTSARTNRRYDPTSGGK